MFQLFHIWCISDDYDATTSSDAYKYFEEDILVHSHGDDDQGPPEDELALFDKLAKKMVNLTDDGGVKKQILVQGVGNDVPPGSSVTGVLILFALSFQEKNLQFLD